MAWNGMARGLLLLVSAVLAQGKGGTITGTLTDPEGRAVIGAMVQVKRIPDGMIYRTESTSGGKFSIAQLTAGKYELSVPDVGFKFNRFVQKDPLTIEQGQTVRSDIRLTWGNLGSLGDDIYLEAHNKAAAKKLTGRAPRMSNGKPDLSGVWLGTTDSDPEKIETLPWVDAVMKEREENGFKELPSADCLPGEPVPSSPLPYKIVQTPSLIVQLYEYDPHYRQVYLDGRPHPKDLDPTWTGHSIGKWEGDTLVIDTVGFNDKAWLSNLMPHTDKLHVVERYTRPDLAHLNVDIMMDDPGAFKKPWHMHLVWELAPDEDIPETVCTENNHYYRELAGEKK
jgi:Carboxypeptidase regulatory-like domain